MFYIKQTNDAIKYGITKLSRRAKDACFLLSFSSPGGAANLENNCKQVLGIRHEHCLAGRQSEIEQYALHYSGAWAKQYRAMAQILLSSPLHNTRNGIAKQLFSCMFSFKVHSPEQILAEAKPFTRLSESFSRSFAEAILANDTKLLKDLPSSALQYLQPIRHETLPENFSCFYGARIAEQLDFVLKELTENNSTRRATICILDKYDHKLQALESAMQMEFSCTQSISFFIDNGELLMHVHMRSQSFSLFVLDCYNFSSLQRFIANKLGISAGNHIVSIANLHLLEKDFELAEKLSKCADLYEYTRLI